MGQEADAKTASLPLVQGVHCPMEAVAIGVPGKQTIPVGQTSQGHRFLLQGVDDMVVVDDLGTVGLVPSRQGFDPCGAVEELDSVVEDPSLQLVADEPGRDGVVDLAQVEAGGTGDCDSCFGVLLGR